MLAFGLFTGSEVVVSKTLAGLLLFILLILAFVGFELRDSGDVNFADGPYPSESDERAIAFFMAHQAQFVRLRELIQGTPFMYLNAGWKEVTPPEAFEKAPEVEEEIRKLMKELKLRSVNGTQSDWGIRLGFLDSKSFWAGEAPAGDVVASTENFVPNGSASKRVFRRIEPGWYLTVDWGG